MIRVEEGARDDVPGYIPFNILLIDEDTLELYNRETRMCIVELDSSVVGELCKRLFEIPESPQDVGKACSCPQVLLFEPEQILVISEHRMYNKTLSEHTSTLSLRNGYH